MERFADVALYVLAEGSQHYVGKIVAHQQFCGTCGDLHYDAWNAQGIKVAPENGYGFNSVAAAARAIIEESPFVPLSSTQWVTRQRWIRIQRKLDKRRRLVRKSD